MNRFSSAISTFSPSGKYGTTLSRPKLTAFFASFFLAAAFILPFTIAAGGIFYVSNDQVTQQIPLAQQVVSLLHSGDFLYDFNMDLGTGVIESYSWYNLGSVFTLFYLIFPHSVTPYLMAPALMLKFATGGLFSYLWIRRHTKTDLSALCASILYTFSGFWVTNLVFPFADVYALFPLLPYAMDRLVDTKKFGLFAVAICLNILVNPPLFFGTAVFMIIYFFVKLAHKTYQISIKEFLFLALEAVCGVALSGFLLVPFVLSLTANPRVGSMLSFGAEWVFHTPHQYFELFRSMVLPAEVMHQNTLMTNPDATSPELYLPMFGLVFVFSFLMHRRKSWLRSILLVCAVCLFIPILNSAFNAFNGTYYTRWLYMPVLCVALATVQVLEDKNISIKKGFVLYGGIAAIFTVCMLAWQVYFKNPSTIIHLPLFIFLLVITAFGLIFTATSRIFWQNCPRVLVVAVALFGFGTAGLNIFFNQQIAKADYGPLPVLAQNTIYAGKNTPLPNGNYRIYVPNVSNTYFDHGSPFSFNSTLPGGIFNLQEAFGRNRTSISRIEFDEVGLWSLLGVEYLLSPVADPAVYPLPNLTLFAESTPFSILKNEDALPLIIGFDAVISQAYADTLSNHEKSIAMLHGIVLSDTESAEPSMNVLSSADSLTYETGIAARKSMSATDVTADSAYVSANISMPNDGMILITLPYDTGWQCEINGEPVDLIQADYGLMAAFCPQGDSTITLSYFPPGGTLGIVLSVIGLLCLLAFCIKSGLIRFNKPT